MESEYNVYRDIAGVAEQVPALSQKLRAAAGREAPIGIAGFDGFIDTFIRIEKPATMAEFGPKVAAAAGIAASYPVHHIGDKFGGNGPLLASALHGLFAGKIDLTYIGGLGEDEVLPIFRDALEDKVSRIITLAAPAHSDCLEFEDGKVMLSDMRSCADISWERLQERIDGEQLDTLLRASQFIGAVNWGKLPHVGNVWRNLAQRLSELGVERKSVTMFMDLAEFEQRERADVAGLIELLPTISAQCHTILSFNLKEAWQMGEYFGSKFQGLKSPESVAELAAFLKSQIHVDRVVIHPNDGAACASAAGTSYVPGPLCKKPLISTGAGDNFGAGCLSGALLGLDDVGMLLCGVGASGWFVRSGQSPSLAQIGELLQMWQGGALPERLGEDA